MVTMYDPDTPECLLAVPPGCTKTVRMEQTQDGAPVTPDRGPETQAPESRRGFAMDLVQGLIAAKAAGPIIENAGQVIVDKAREVFGGQPDATATPPPDDGDN